MLLDLADCLADEEGEGQHQLELVGRVDHREAHCHDVVPEAQQVLLLPLLPKCLPTLNSRSMTSILGSSSSLSSSLRSLMLRFRKKAAQWYIAQSSSRSIANRILVARRLTLPSCMLS